MCDTGGSILRRRRWPGPPDVLGPAGAGNGTADGGRHLNPDERTRTAPGAADHRSIVDNVTARSAAGRFVHVHS
ncbi:hypothetical protein GCM10009533_18550 [Saccharopolyspora spinosporotrichia]|uniref:Uncharacterized protein n=1 Tax=Saccharopolyspora erythraea TaxID=1836 RepID=A0ABP3MFZ9_SACER